MSTSEPNEASGRITRQEFVVPRPRSPTQTPVADKAASTGMDVRYGGTTTTVTGLEAGQGNGNIDKTPTIPHDSPLPRVNILGSDEGSMTLQELMVFCTTLSKKVESLETNLKQTKQIYGAAYTRLIKKGRYEHDMEFDFDFDAAKEVSTAKKDVSTISPTRNTGVSTADDITMAKTMVYIRKSAVKEKAMRLQAKLEEEERQRIVKGKSYIDAGCKALSGSR
ncbi:hypothetical protein Tco_0456186 [Tanacetum coccineum]